jgi:hypothetical protein
MARNDLSRLRQVLSEAVKALPMPVRELERRLGVGSGNLYRLIDGALDLRIRHLLALAELLGVPPTDFLEMGCPAAMAGATRRLSDWIGSAKREPAAVPTAASLSLDELKELIRDTVREALDQREREEKPPRRRRARP